MNMQLITETYTTDTVICFICSQWNNYQKTESHRFF